MDVIRDIRRKEKFQIDDEYLNGYARHCGPMATLVYLSLCRHANNSQQCFPSKKLISEELNIGERGVYNGLKTLEEWHIIRFWGRDPYQHDDEDEDEERGFSYSEHVRRRIKESYYQ